MTYDELVEKVARALDPSMWKEHDQRGNMPTSIIISKGHAKTAIDTIREVLMEPTPAMEVVVSKNWGRRTWSEYRDVLAASPLGEKSE